MWKINPIGRLHIQSFQGDMLLMYLCTQQKLKSIFSKSAQNWGNCTRGVIQLRWKLCIMALININSKQLLLSSIVKFTCTTNAHLFLDAACMNSLGLGTVVFPSYSKQIKRVQQGHVIEYGVCILHLNLISKNHS